MKTCLLKLIICVKSVSCMPARRNVSLDVILTYMLCVKNFSMYSCGIDGETFERIILCDGLISGLIVVYTLLIIIVL